MRDRQRIIDTLEDLYRNQLDSAAKDEGLKQNSLDFKFQRDQIYLEIILDIRDLLISTPEEQTPVSSIMDKAQQLRNLTRLR